MNKKLFKTGIAILLWAIFAFGMSILYYWLKDKGWIWDNPDMEMWADGKLHDISATWNSRKVIVGIVALSSFVLTFLRIIFIWDEK